MMPYHYSFQSSFALTYTPTPFPSFDFICIRTCIYQNYAKILYIMPAFIACTVFTQLYNLPVLIFLYLYFVIYMYVQSISVFITYTAFYDHAHAFNYSHLVLPICCIILYRVSSEHSQGGRLRHRCPLCRLQQTTKSA